MSTIEIKQRNKFVIGFFIIGLLLFLLVIFGTFFTEENTLISKIFTFVGFLYFCYLFYSPLKKIATDQAILIFNDDSIILNSENQVINKSEIKEIDVHYITDDGYFLKIVTDKKEIQISINFLSKTPDEMKELIKRYKN